jgi:glycosyltransferase involved in cell wall biosynthesis
MKVSVIIGSYRQGDDLYRCLESLINQTIYPDEIIIGVDTIQDKQNDHFLNERVLCKFIASGKTGLSAARNVACQEANGDIFAFIDDDATADPNWIKCIHTTFEDSEVSCVGGPVIPIFESKSIPERWYWIIGCTGISKRPIGTNIAISKNEFIFYNGFSENLGRTKHNLTIGEETEMILNLERDNKKVIWEPKMIVYHSCPKTRTQWSYILSRAYKEGLGKSIISEHHTLRQEKRFLKYYLTHPDLYTPPILLSTILGFIKGNIDRILK